MNKYSRNKAKNEVFEKLSVQHLSVQKLDKREKFRICEGLQKEVEKFCK